MKIDPGLIKACIKQNRKAQLKLYKLCFDDLMGVCMRYRMDENSAAEVLNIGFLKILTNLGKYHFEGPFIAWAKRILINVIIDEFRKEKRHRAKMMYVEGYEGVGTPSGAHLPGGRSEVDVDQILMWIQQLPPLRKQVFNLYAIDGYTHQEVSEMLKIPEGTSKWHLSEARKTIQEKIRKYMLTSISIQDASSG